MTLSRASSFKTGAWLPRVAAWLPLAAGVAALVSFTATNIVASRFFKRWDLTPDGLYSLSSVTVDLLQHLDAPLDVIVLLPRGDALTSSVQYMLDAYRAKSAMVRPRFVDPDRNPAEFFAIQREYGLLEGKTEDGRVAEDASIVVAQGQHRWFITTDDMVAYDDETGSAKPRLEQVLTEGLAAVRKESSAEVCVLRGHGELGWNAAGPQGLEELRTKMTRNNLKVREIELSETGGHVLDKCDAVLDIGASRPFGLLAAQELLRAFDAGSNLLLALAPIVNDDGRVLDPGLSALLAPHGVRVAQNVVLERDAALRMPVGLGGEVFLATPKAHPVTLGMLHGEEVEMRVLLQLAQSFDVSEKSSARALLESGPTSVALDDFRVVRSGTLPTNDTDALSPGALGEKARILALAIEQTRAADARAGRIALLGSPSVFWSTTFREPALLGTRRFVENLLAWTVARRPMIDVPEKVEHPIGVSLTDEALSEVRRYVLLYMPACAGLIGVLLLLRRRDAGSGETRSGE